MVGQRVKRFYLAAPGGLVLAQALTRGQMTRHVAAYKRREGRYAPRLRVYLMDQGTVDRQHLHARAAQAKILAEGRARLPPSAAA